MGNSTITLQNIVDDARSFGDLAPVLPTSGYGDSPALSIASDVMAALLVGGPNAEPFNWKWNRFNLPTFSTISFQQDYFLPGLSNLAWLESAWASNINTTSIPKEKIDLEVHRDLQVTYNQTGYPGKICWIPNDQCITGTWGASPLGPVAGGLQGQQSMGSNLSGQQNPGPNVIYTNPIGQVNAPINPTTVITDPNGNLWAVTTYGTCDVTEPTWPANPTFPTFQLPNAVATTVTDGTVVWTAVDPKGQGIRLNPIPPQTGVVWQIEAVGQMRPPTFIRIQQTLDPIPDDYVTYFKEGFFAQCYRRSPDPKIRARFAQEWGLWLKGLDNAIKQGQREMDDMGFYPGSGVMETGYGGYAQNRPDRPYGPV